MSLNALYVLLPILLWPLCAVILTKYSRAKGSLGLSFYRQLSIAIIGIPLLFIFSSSLMSLKTQIVPIVLASLFGSLYVFFTFLGFDYLPVGFSRVYVVLSRVFISIGIGLFVLHEMISQSQIIGIALIVIGIIFLKPKNIDVSHLKKSNPHMGILLAIISGGLFTLTLYYFKIYSEPLNPLLSAYILETVNGLFLAIPFFIRSKLKSKNIKFSQKDFKVLLLLSPLILLGTYGTAKAYEVLSFSIINVLFVFILVFSMIYGRIFLKEKLSKKQIVIFGIMVIGLIFLKF